MVRDAPNTLQAIVQRANEAKLEVSRYGLTRMDQLIAMVNAKELEKAKKDNSPNLADLQSKSCFRKVTTALHNLDRVSKILDKDGKENTSKVYLFKKLAEISDHKMGEVNDFASFGDNTIYEKLTEKDKAVNSQLSQKIAQTLGSVSSLANSIYKAYEYPFILENMKERCEEIEKQKLSQQGELGQMAEGLKKLTEKIPESSAERMRDKILLENIQFTLNDISMAAKETMKEVSANGIVDKLAEPINKLTSKLNTISKVAEIIDKYEQIEGENADKKFLLGKIGELSKYNLSEGSQGLKTLNSLLNPDISLSEAVILQQFIRH